MPLRRHGLLRSRRPPRLAALHPPAERMRDLLCETRPAEHETAIGRPPYVDCHVLSGGLEQRPIGLLLRLRAAPQPVILLMRHDQVARLTLGVDPVATDAL